MKTLYIERSTGDSRDGGWALNLDIEGIERIVVGTGPGSFAGIRSALAFAQGVSLGQKCEVAGLTSAAALAGDGPVAVIGDARRGKFWVALFDGYKQLGKLFLSDTDSLKRKIPAGFKVTTPDAKRIDGVLRDIFGESYIGGKTPDAEGLRRFAENNPEALEKDPLPIYLSPAVRED